MTTQVLITSGSTWTVPADCISAAVEAIGGGQGGNATNGGNGGDYAKANTVSLTPGASVAVQIGAGGAGVASGTQNAGTDTKFGTSVLAKGGGSAFTNIGDTTFAGGAGGASGGGGGAAGPSGAGGAASGTTGGQGDGAAGGAGGTSGNAGAAGAEWVTAGSGGGGGAAAAATVPTFVQGGNACAGAISVSVTLAAAPTVGNLLVAAFRAGGTSTIQPAAGWTQVGTNAANSRFIVYKKVSDGSETTTTFGVTSGSPALGLSIVELQSGTTGTLTSSSANESGNSISFGPSDAPVSPNAIPLVLINLGSGGTGKTWTWSSPWTGSQPDTTSINAQPMYGYQATPPNAAVSGTVTMSASTMSGVEWFNVWIEPN